MEISGWTLVNKEATPTSQIESRIYVSGIIIIHHHRAMTTLLIYSSIFPPNQHPYTYTTTPCNNPTSSSMLLQLLHSSSLRLPHLISKFPRRFTRFHSLSRPLSSTLTSGRPIHSFRVLAMAQHTSTSSHKHSNRLATEHSPYLLQHAHNPVILPLLSLSLLLYLSIFLSVSMLMWYEFFKILVGAGLL